MVFKKWIACFYDALKDRFRILNDLNQVKSIIKKSLYVLFKIISLISKNRVFPVLDFQPSPCEVCFVLTT